MDDSRYLKSKHAKKCISGSKYYSKRGMTRLVIRYSLKKIPSRVVTSPYCDYDVSVIKREGLLGLRGKRCECFFFIGENILLAFKWIKT